MTVIIYRLDAENQSYAEVSRFQTSDAPREFLINDSGTRIVSLDGYANRVLAVMDGSGKDLKTWKLTDLHRPEVIKGMAETTSSTIWRGRARMELDGDFARIFPPSDPLVKSATEVPMLMVNLQNLKIIEDR